MMRSMVPNLRNDANLLGQASMKEKAQSDAQTKRAGAGEGLSGAKRQRSASGAVAAANVVAQEVESPFKATDGALIRGERRTYGSKVITSCVPTGSHACPIGLFCGCAGRVNQLPSEREVLCVRAG